MSRPFRKGEAHGGGVSADRMKMADERANLLRMVQAHADERECWENAGTGIIESQVRARLESMGIDVSADLALGLMAAAMVVAEHAPEFGGDARDVLGELCLIGLGLLGDPPAT